MCMHGCNCVSTQLTLHRYRHTWEMLWRQYLLHAIKRVLRVCVCVYVVSQCTYKLCSRCVCSVSQSCPALCEPMHCSPPGSSVHGFSRQEYWSGWGSHALLQGDLLDPGIELTSPVSPPLQTDSLPTEPSGKHWSLLNVQ